MVIYDRNTKQYKRVIYSEKLDLFLVVKDVPGEWYTREALKNMLQKGIIEYVED